MYSNEIKEDNEFSNAKKLADTFAKLDGRRPRIMIAKFSQNNHNHNSKLVATGYADSGFDVDISPLFQTPKEAVKQALENDVHILGISSLPTSYKTLIPQVIAELKTYNREDIIVIASGVIPPQDYTFLYKKGVSGIFGSKTKISTAAIDILNILIDSIEE